jgi:hypothetical protein
VSCYDDNTNLKEQITLKGLNKFLTDIWDSAFIYHNGALVIQSYSEKKIIKLFFLSFKIISYQEFLIITIILISVYLLK